MIQCRIPDTEFRQRIERLQVRMKQENIDILLAYGNEAEPQYVRYFSDYWPSFETAGVLVPNHGRPLLLIGPESLTYAADRSRIADIRLLKAFRESSEPEYPGKQLDTFQTVIDECLGGTPPKRIGIAGMGLITMGVYRDLVDQLDRYGKTDVLKADSLVNDLRTIKTSSELECMRAAAAVTRQTFDYVLDVVRPGMTESQVVGIALGKMHELGAERESYPMWVLTGAGSHQAISRARHKAICSGDSTEIQLGARIGGYASSIGRPVVFGKATSEQRSLIEAGYAAQDAVIGRLKAGTAAAEVAQHYEKVVRDLGYGDWLLYGPCHGNGLMEGEPPWVETNSDWVFHENMTFCVDIFLGNVATQTGLRIEDVVCIQKDGVEQLTDYPRKLFEL